MRLEGIEPSSQVWKTWVMAVIRQPLNIIMKKINEGNLYNVETATNPSASDQTEYGLKIWNKEMRKQLGQHLARNNETPDRIKQIIATTFGSDFEM